MNPAVNKATKGLGGSFKGVTLYLVTPKADEPAAERMGFVMTQNLATDDPAQAWKIMARTAQDRDALKTAAGVSAAGRKPREVKPVFHYALSWHPDQKPTVEQMQEAARSSLRALKLEGHQALIVQHVDEDRAHLHVVVNRVHPETGKLDPLSNNIRRLDRWANEYEKASGEIVSRDRAAKYEALDKGEPPPPPTKMAKPRKEWEAEQPPQGNRTADHADRLARYKQAATKVREQFRPEWASHYREQRREEQALAKQQRATLLGLKQAAQFRRQPLSDFEKSAARGIGSARKNELVTFYNQHRELIWQGIPAEQRPTDSRAIVNAPALRRAIDTAHAKQRAALEAQQAAAKKDLQRRHEQARQQAQRAAWASPAPATPTEGEKAPKRDWGRVAMGAAVIAAGAAAAHKKAGADPTPQKPVRDPQRDLDEAAARIARPKIGRPANESPGTPPPPQDDLAQGRGRGEAAAERIKQARARNARARNRGRERDWLD